MAKESAQDIRWLQRYNNYKKALSKLSSYIEVDSSLNELEEQGLIQAFEYTYELAWNTIKDFYFSQGEISIQGSRDAIKLAFKRGLIVDGEAWMGMIQDRNRTTHTYDQETAQEIVKNIKDVYLSLFHDLRNQFEKIVEQQ